MTLLFYIRGHVTAGNPTRTFEGLKEMARVQLTVYTLSRRSLSLSALIQDSFSVPVVTYSGVDSEMQANSIPFLRFPC